MASILIYATGECCLFSLVRISEFLPLIKRGGKKLHWLLLITKSQLQTIDLFFLKNTTHLARGNNLVVSLEEVTSTHNRILLESYSLGSTACRTRKKSYNGDLFMYSHVKHFWYNPNQTGYEWTKLGYETAQYETTVRKKRLDTLLKSKMLSAVLNKRPPRICFFY